MAFFLNHPHPNPAEISKLAYHHVIEPCWREQTLTEMQKRAIRYIQEWQETIAFLNTKIACSKKYIDDLEQRKEEVRADRTEKERKMKESLLREKEEAVREAKKKLQRAIEALEKAKKAEVTVMDASQSTMDFDNSEKVIEIRQIEEEDSEEEDGEEAKILPTLTKRQRQEEFGVTDDDEATDDEEEANLPLPFKKQETAQEDLAKSQALYANEEKNDDDDDDDVDKDLPVTHDSFYSLIH